MRLVEAIGHALRPIRSDAAKLTAAEFREERAQPLEVSSPAFANKQTIPSEYSMAGKNSFPGLRWGDIPVLTQSLLLVVEDPDAPKPTPFIHAIVYNIPPQLKELPTNAFLDGSLTKEYMELGIKCGTNTLSQSKYMGPAPPPGHGDHHYYFQLFALDSALDFTAPPTLHQIKSAIEDHVLAHGETVGLYRLGD